MEEKKKNKEGGNTNLRIRRSSFIKNMRADITLYYEVIKKIGEGTYGKVYKVKNKESGEERAMKQILKEKIPDLSNFKNEIKILTKLDHPNIIRLYEVFEDDKYFYLFIELCSGGSLFNKMHNSGYNLSEKEVANIFKQLISAIAYIHDQGICHRDLKLENLLFLTEDNNNPILKIIDFGFSIDLKNEDKKEDSPNLNNNKKLTSKVGTLYYISPEIVKGNYDEKCDIWACGVILYILLCGKQPFKGKNDKEIYKNIINMKYDLNSKEWKLKSKNVKDLIKNMLCPAEKRYTPKQILDSKWIKDKTRNITSDIDIEDFDTLKMIEYQFYNKLKKAVLIFMAGRLGPTESKKTRELFMAMDEEKKGIISIDDFIKGLLDNEQTKDISVQDIREMFMGIDTDRNGTIDYTEFLASNIDREIYLKEEKLKEAFRAFDLGDKGYITKDDIIKILNIENNSKNEKSINKLIEDNDYDKDGKIDYIDFVKMMKQEIFFDDSDNYELNNDEEK